MVGSGVEVGVGVADEGTIGVASGVGVGVGVANGGTIGVAVGVGVGVGVGVSGAVTGAATTGLGVARGVGAAVGRGVAAGADGGVGRTVGVDGGVGLATAGGVTVGCATGPDVAAGVGTTATVESDGNAAGVGVGSAAGVAPGVGLGSEDAGVGAPPPGGAFVGAAVGAGFAVGVDSVPGTGDGTAAMFWLGTSVGPGTTVPTVRAIPASTRFTSPRATTRRARWATVTAKGGLLSRRCELGSRGSNGSTDRAFRPSGAAPGMADPSGQRHQLQGRVARRAVSGQALEQADPVDPAIDREICCNLHQVRADPRSG
ncbi:MAG: hypothetical protein QOJ75_1972, partial [Chloroflexota bacterium]|nr:hypothetical protein [Chloroflexota bacterium]